MRGKPQTGGGGQVGYLLRPLWYWPMHNVMHPVHQCRTETPHPFTSCLYTFGLCLATVSIVLGNSFRLPYLKDGGKRR